MNITDWKKQINQTLTSIFFKANAQLPTSTYGAITAATLIPLVDAFATGGPGAFWALAGPVFGGVGSSLLANNMQRWADQQSAAPSAEEFAQQLATTLREEAENNEVLRTALDEMNQAVESITIAAEATNAENRDAFVQALRTELSQLGNIEHYAETINRIENSGSGSVLVGDHGKAGGERSVVADTVKAETINTGDTTNITNYYGESKDDQFGKKTELARVRYLERLRKVCQTLPLASLGGDMGMADDISLDNVYIQLNTTSRIDLTDAEKEKWQKEERDIPEDSKRVLTAHEATEKNKRVLLLGDPGGGKSTFVKQLIARNATMLLNQQEISTPLFVILHELIGELSSLQNDESFQKLVPTEQQKSVLNLIAVAWRKSLPEFNATDFENELKRIPQEEKSLLVLDGLDEVPEGLRTLLLSAIPYLTTHYPGIQQVIVTCRVRSYYDGMLPSFTAYTLAPFTATQIEHFIKGWYKAQHELGKMNLELADHNIQDLYSAARNENLQKLASNPMLLTTMTIVHQEKTRLPDEQVELYALAVEVLTRRWQSHKNTTESYSDELKALLDKEHKLRPILETIAYTAHKAQSAISQLGTDAADESQYLLRKGELIDLLDQQLDGNTHLAVEFLNYIDHRAGLLVGNGGDESRNTPTTYSFPHRTFQEYLSGCHMIQGWESDVADRYEQHAPEGDYWSVAALLGAEELYYIKRDRTRVLQLAYALCPIDKPANEGEWRATLWSAQMALLVGRKDIESDSKRDRGPAYLERLLDRLVQLPHTNHLSMTERAEAGEALGRLGDPRFNPAAWYLPAEADLGFREINAGAFTMGTTPKLDNRSSKREQPQHQQNLERFFISRYQLTVAQWRSYCDATKHKPASAGSLRDPDNNPVRYIRWDEAMAYCQWLTEELREWDQTPEPLATLLRNGDTTGIRWQFTLPSEAQWERAARGTDGRIYPYGNDFYANLGNTTRTGIGRPIAVGFFPKGKSPEECLDMSGNLFDWTLSKFQNYPYNATDGREDLEDWRVARVVRGGSFSHNLGIARAAHRRSRQDGTLNIVGFRMVCAPITYVL